MMIYTKLTQKAMEFALPIMGRWIVWNEEVELFFRAAACCQVYCRSLVWEAYGRAW